MELTTLNSREPVRQKLLAIDERLQPVEDTLISLAAVSVFLIAVLITIGVTGRYVFNNPIREVQPVVKYYLMPLTIFLTFPYVERNDENIRVTLIYKNLKPAYKRYLGVGYRAVSTFILLFLVQQSTTTALEYIRQGQQIYGLDIPLGYSWAVIPIGFTFLALRLILDGALALTGEPEDQETGNSYV